MTKGAKSKTKQRPLECENKDCGRIMPAHVLRECESEVRMFRVMPNDPSPKCRKLYYCTPFCWEHWKSLTVKTLMEWYQKVELPYPMLLATIPLTVQNLKTAIGHFVPEESESEDEDEENTEEGENKDKDKEKGQAQEDNKPQNK